MSPAFVRAPELVESAPSLSGSCADGVEDQVRAALGSKRADMLLAWVALLGDYMPRAIRSENGRVHSGHEPTIIAIGDAVRRYPQDAANEFRVSLDALARYVIAATDPHQCGRIASSVAGGLDYELMRLRAVDVAEACQPVAAYWYDLLTGVLPLFGAFCEHQQSPVHDREILGAARRAHVALRSAAAEAGTKAGPKRVDRPSEQFRKALRALQASSHDRSATWVFYNLRQAERNLIDEIAQAAGLDLRDDDFPESAINRKVLMSVLSKAAETRKGRTPANERRAAEVKLCNHYLWLTGKERPDYTKRLDYYAGDSHPFQGPYVDFLERVGGIYPVGSGVTTLAYLLPWQLQSRPERRKAQLKRSGQFRCTD